MASDHDTVAFAGITHGIIFQVRDAFGNQQIANLETYIDSAKIKLRTAKKWSGYVVDSNKMPGTVTQMTGI